MVLGRDSTSDSSWGRSGGSSRRSKHRGCNRYCSHGCPLAELAVGRDGDGSPGWVRDLAKGLLRRAGARVNPLTLPGSADLCFSAARNLGLQGLAGSSDEISLDSL